MWIETGGDSLTFSESHLLGAELGLRLAVSDRLPDCLRLGLVTFVPLEVDSIYSSPWARLLANSWCTPIPKGELARHYRNPLVARPTVLLRAGLDDGVPETTPTDRETKARGRLDHLASTGHFAMCSDIVVCRLDTVTECLRSSGCSVSLTLLFCNH